MISTKLASAVLETKVKSVKQDGNEIEFFGENFQSLGKYNIYEFIHKNIKDWLYVEGETFLSGISKSGNCIANRLTKDYWTIHDNFKGETEIEALVKLSESVLNDNS